MFILDENEDDSLRADNEAKEVMSESTHLFQKYFFYWTGAYFSLSVNILHNKL